MAGHHERTSLLPSCNGLDDLVVEEHLGGHVRGVDVFQPATQTRNDLTHASQKTVAVNRIVGIPLVIGQADAVSVMAVALHPLSVQMNHGLSPRADPDCELMGQEVGPQRRQFGAQEHFPDKASERLPSTQRPHIGSASLGDLLQGSATTTSNIRAEPSRSLTVSQQIDQLCQQVCSRPFLRATHKLLKQVRAETSGARSSAAGEAANGPDNVLNASFIGRWGCWSGGRGLVRRPPWKFASHGCKYCWAGLRKWGTTEPLHGLTRQASACQLNGSVTLPLFWVPLILNYFIKIVI